MWRTAIVVILLGVHYDSIFSNLTFFVAFLFQSGLSVGTAKSYLATVQHEQISLGLRDPHRGTNAHAGVCGEGAEEEDGRLNLSPQATDYPSDSTDFENGVAVKCQ